jgi:hypothetical protein
MTRSRSCCAAPTRKIKQRNDDCPRPLPQYAHPPMTNTDQTQQPEDLNRELALRAHERESEFFNTNNNAAIKSGEDAIKALTLINGGSSVAMLAFVGTLASKDQYTSEQLALVAAPLIWFATGVGLAVAAACLSYFSNRAIAELSLTRVKTWQDPFVTDGERSKRWRAIQAVLVSVTILVAALSLASFGCGVWTAKVAFEQLPKHAPHTMPSGTRNR